MKRIIKVCSLFLFIVLLSGCFKRDNFEGIDISTTVYPIEYITDRLYGKNSTITSIYPSGVKVSEYKLSEKQVKDYSKTNLFIFDGISSEKNYVSEFFKHNKSLKIIDATSSMEAENGNEALWLDPSNFLMMAQNIRYGLSQYIDNHYLKNEIDDNYSKLKEEISRLDASIYEISDNASFKTLVVSSDLFKFLEKYDLNVISLEENENLTEKTIADVVDLINDGKIQYIILKQDEEMNDTIKKIVNETNVEVVYYHMLSNLTGEERNAKKDYISIMSDNIDILRNELYD